MSFDGSIFAEIGADTRAYERAMNEIAVMTKQAFDNAQKAAVNSSNQMIQKIGQLMNELASNSSTATYESVMFSVILSIVADTIKDSVSSCVSVDRKSVV